MRRAGAAIAGTTWSPTVAFAATSSAPATTQSFTGQRADATAGLFYYGARYYDNVGSTFTSADTAADGLNRYGYVGYNPTTATDPSGHRRCLDDCGDGGGKHEGPPPPPIDRCVADPTLCQQDDTSRSGDHSGDYSPVTNDDWDSCWDVAKHPAWCEKYGDYESDPSMCMGSISGRGDGTCPYTFRLNWNKLHWFMNYAFVLVTAVNITATYIWQLPNHVLGDIFTPGNRMPIYHGYGVTAGLSLSALGPVTVTLGVGILISKGGDPSGKDVRDFLNLLSVSRGGSWLFFGNYYVFNAGGFAIERTLGTSLVDLSIGIGLNFSCAVTLAGFRIDPCLLL